MDETKEVKFEFPHANNTKIVLQKRAEDSNWKAFFSWNDGELESHIDYEIPICGFGPTLKEAIGDLIIKYDTIKTMKRRVNNE